MQVKCYHSSHTNGTEQQLRLILSRIGTQRHTQVHQDVHLGQHLRLLAIQVRGSITILGH